VRWQRQDEAAGVIEGFLVYMRREDLTYFLSIPAQDMAA
jgi:hypothetical protein